MNIKKSFKSKSFKYGSVSFIIMAIVIVIAVALNMAMLALPSEYTRFDVSKDRLYELSDDARDLISSYKDDIEINYIAEDGNEDEIVYELIARAATLNSHITLKKIDPVKNPELVGDYSAYPQNSFVVKSAKRETVVSYSDIYQNKYYLNGEEISSKEYQQYMMYAQLGYSSAIPTTEQHYAGESKLANALDYVCTDILPVAYYLTGHGEQDINENFAESIEKDNILLKELKLVTSGSVPEDASCIIINIPDSDISEDEYTKLHEYIISGGNIMLHTFYKYTDMPNMYKLLGDFGMESVDGIVMENDPNMYNQQYYYLYPNIQDSIYTQSISGKYIFAPVAHGIKKTEQTPENVSVTPLLETSESSYLRPIEHLEDDNAEKTDDDIPGPFMIGAASQYTADGKTGNVLWFSTAYLASDANDNNGAAHDLYIGAVNSFCDKDIQGSVAIATKIISNERLTIPSGSIALIATVMILIIPCGCIAIGLWAWLKRRKK